MYEAYFIDVDYTLLDFSSDEKNAFFGMSKAAGLPSGESEYRKYRRVNEHYWEMLSRGQISKDVLRLKRFEDWLRLCGFSGDAERLNLLFSEALSRHAEKIDGAENLLQELSRRAPLAAVTNGVGFIQRRRLALSGLGKYFSALVISEEAGAEKPDPRIFKFALDALRVSGPKNVLMVGDSPESDILGALAAGLDACLFDPGDRHFSVPCTHRVKALKDVLAL